MLTICKVGIRISKYKTYNYTMNLCNDEKSKLRKAYREKPPWVEEV